MLTRKCALLAGLFVLLMWLGAIKVVDTGEKAFLTGLSLAALVPIMWVDTVRKCGLRCLSAVPMMGRIFLKSKRGGTTAGIVVVLLFFWLSPFDEYPSPYRLHMSAALLLAFAFLWLQPPFALMLGKSARETGRALAALSSAASPLRVVALLDHRKAGFIVGTFSPLTDNLRAESDAHWRSVVDEVADAVPLIVLDARSDSQIVASEVGQLLEKPDRLRRTLFVVGSGGEAPALARHGLAAGSPGVRVTREEDIEEVVKRDHSL